MYSVPDPFTWPHGQWGSRPGSHLFGILHFPNTKNLKNKGCNFWLFSNSVHCSCFPTILRQYLWEEIKSSQPMYWEMMQKMLGPHSAINISSRDQNDMVVLASKTCLMHLRRRTLYTRHEKTDLKVFVVVILKEEWSRPSFFGYDTDNKILFYRLNRL